METAPKTDSSGEPAKVPQVEFAGDVLQEIRQHARSSMRAEICGVLIGGAADGVTRVCARIAGEGASQGGAHVTFTQDTWEHIYKIKDAQFPSQSIVGWYHSHPGFGIFLSDYDLFIHENFFTAEHQIAWVFDPHSDEEGCFGWVGKKVEPLEAVTVVRKHHPPAPEQTEDEAASRKAAPAQDPLAKDTDKGVGVPRRRGHIGMMITVAIVAFASGVLLGPLLLLLTMPRPVPVSGPTGSLQPSGDAPGNRSGVISITPPAEPSPAMVTPPVQPAKTIDRATTSAPPTSNPSPDSPPKPPEATPASPPEKPVEPKPVPAPPAAGTSGAAGPEPSAPNPTPDASPKEKPAAATPAPTLGKPAGPKQKSESEPGAPSPPPTET